MNINLQFYKITEKKMIFTLSYKGGNKSTYLKMMKDFCEENSQYFKLF